MPRRPKLLQLLAQTVALYVADALASRTTLEPPRPRGTLDLGDYEAEGLAPEVAYVRPAPISDVSVAIARALREDGVTSAELARRIGVARSVVSRLTDPLYFGHSTRTLRGVAVALGRRLEVSFERP